MRRIGTSTKCARSCPKFGPNETGEVEVAEEVAVDDEETVIAE